MAWKRSEGGHIYQSPEPKPQQRRREVQLATDMGQHHQEESEGKQAKEGGGPHHHHLAQSPPIASVGRQNWRSWEESVKAFASWTLYPVY